LGRLLITVSTVSPVPTVAFSQATKAERTNYAETSSHADVLGFLDSLASAGALFRRGTLATSPRGREVPVVIAARPMVDGPAEAHRSGKPVIYVQANIHAGEVEGKEAAQMLLRDLTLGALRPLLDSIVLILVPIYNTDGNDAFGNNRPGQNGPAIVGVRPNGQGLDLNRDYVKQEAPETRGAAALVAAWDPDIFVDLHTTNGSYHGYQLTYSPGLNPNSPPANEWGRDHFLPELRRRMRARHRREVFSYGNFRNQHPDSLVLGWETYDPRPRFGTNWFGMRGRVSILSEAYSNADFSTRVGATYDFVLELLRLAAAERTTIRALADRGAPQGDSLALRSELAPPQLEDVIAEITEPAGEGAGSFSRRRRTGTFRTIRMPVFDRFQPARKEAIPAAYLLPPEHAHLAQLLRGHGIRVSRLTAPWAGAAEAFRVDSLIASAGVFEGHREVRVEGSWQPRPAAVTTGWFVVPTAQRLGLLAAYLLEPASEDGFATWNLLDRDLRRGRDAAILRTREFPVIPATELP
jgi:hypothetical protein